MQQHRRSTNARVLSRHHGLSNRSPAAVDPANITAGYPPDTGGDTIPAAVDSSVLPDFPSAISHPVVSPSPQVPSSVTTPSHVASVPPATLSSPPSVTPIPVPSPHSALSTPSTTSRTTTPLTTSRSTVVSTPRVLTTSSGVQASGTNAPSTSSNSANGVSSGAVGGIVTVIVLIALIIIGLLVRKNYQHRRALKRNTWGAGLVPSLESKRDTLYNPSDSDMHPYGGVAEHERLPNVPRFEMSQPPSPGVPSVYITPAATTPLDGQGGYTGPDIRAPASAYNSRPYVAPISPFVPPPPTSAAAPTSAGELAIVARTFIPSLPDELHISNAERIYIINAYDDGWALCVNSQGEQGVVPLECLDRRSGASTDMQLEPHSGIGPEANRTSRRMSSLNPDTLGTY